jgi:hypothetical protein
MRHKLMSKAAINLTSTSALSKIDNRDWSRELWRAAFRMARAMIRARRTRSVGDAYVWYLDHARKRFGASGWPVAQAAGRLVLELRTPGHALGGSVADLHRQGLVNAAGRPTRCIYVEKMTGWRLAWSADPLAAVNANRMLRGVRARQLRDDRARRRAVARAMAEERRRLMAEVEADDRLYVLTAAGEAALAAAGMLDG